MVDYMRMAHTARKEMRCVFFTLVIKRAALKEKYEGGSSAFVEKYHARTNRHLALMCAMSWDYLGEPCGDIIESGLTSKEDFLYFEAMDTLVGISGEKIKAKLGLDKPFNVDDSNWLRGYYKDGGMMVRYVGR